MHDCSRLTPAEEARIHQRASKIGLPSAEYARRLIKQHPPPLGTPIAPPLDEANARAIAQRQAWLNEQATDDAKEILAAAALDAPR